MPQLSQPAARAVPALPAPARHDLERLPLLRVARRRRDAAPPAAPQGLARGAGRRATPAAGRTALSDAARRRSLPIAGHPASTRPAKETPDAERTLILVKPDAYARALSGEIIARFERKGLRPVAVRVLTMTREMAERHYVEHAERPFFGGLVEFITSGPLVAMVLEGESAIKAARQVIGATNPLEARTRLDPRRLRDSDRREPRPRLRQPRGGDPRDRDLLPRASNG